MKMLSLLAILAAVAPNMADARLVKIDSLAGFTKAVDYYQRFDSETSPHVIKRIEQGVDLLTKINIEINERIQYKAEPAGEDHWQTPMETDKLRTGDCEDFAWAKWYELLQNGIDERDMWIESGIESTVGIQHAILRVLINGRSYYLDNETNDINEQTIAPRGMFLINRFGFITFTKD